MAMAPLTIVLAISLFSNNTIDIFEILWKLVFLLIVGFGLGVTLTIENFRQALKLHCFAEKQCFETQSGDSGVVITVRVHAATINWWNEKCVRSSNSTLVAMAYLIAKALGLTPYRAVGLMLVGMSPGGGTSNLFASAHFPFQKKNFEFWNQSFRERILVRRRSQFVDNDDSSLESLRVFHGVPKLLDFKLNFVTFTRCVW